MLKKLFKKLFRRVRVQSICNHDKVFVDTYGFNHEGNRVLILSCNSCAHRRRVTRNEVIKKYGFDPLKVGSND